MSKQQRLGEPEYDQTRHASQQQQHRLNVISPPNPLAISELIEMVGRNLGRHSLTMCLRVCRQWHHVLRSQVWEVIEKYLGGSLPRDPKKSSGPSLPLLSLHAGLVRKLFLKIHTGQIGFPGQLPLYCPWLTELTVVAPEPHILFRTNSVFDENLAPFILEHRATLKTLIFGVHQSKALTEATIACSNLECLKTRVPFLGEGEELDGWRHWYESLGSRLRKLTLIWDTASSVRADDEFIMEKSMDALLSQTSTSSLQRIELRARCITLPTFRFLLSLVMKSPELKHMSWFITNSKPTIMTRLAEAFENSPHGLFSQRLESFSLLNHGIFVMKDFQRVMESFPALKDLELREPVTLLPKGISFYIATLGKLRRLSIAGCRWASPTVVQEILCSMPNLEVFEAEFLSDITLQKDSRPWVCTGLRELRLFFIARLGFPSPDDGTVAEAMMLDRLCQLEGLQKLNFPLDARIITHNGFRIKPFLFLMERGLDKLKTLKQLRSFQAPRGQLWTEAEAQWVLKNWTQLQEIDIDMDSKANELLGHKRMKRSIGGDFGF